MSGFEVKIEHTVHGKCPKNIFKALNRDTRGKIKMYLTAKKL